MNEVLIDLNRRMGLQTNGEVYRLGIGLLKVALEGKMSGLRLVLADEEDQIAREGTLLHTVSPFEEANGPPYLDNEDWPPRASLSRKGPKIEIWGLEP